MQRIFLTMLASLFLITTFTTCSSNNQAAEKKDVIKASSLWIGSWAKDEYQNPGNLDVLNVHNDSIQFELHASSGGHESSIEGIAIAIDTAIAIYSSKEENDSCKIEFKLVGDSIIVREAGNKCVTAVGVMYSGVYKNETYITFENGDEQHKTLFDLEIFKTERTDSIFRLLVGNDYSLFVKSTQLISEDEDLDSLNSVVRSSGIRGLFTQMENIIMIDAADNIWAAVIDDQRVLYFTNSKTHKNKLPRTIENWRKSFKEYPIVYKQ